MPAELLGPGILSICGLESRLFSPSFPWTPGRAEHPWFSTSLGQLSLLISPLLSDLPSVSFVLGSLTEQESQGKLCCLHKSVLSRAGYRAPWHSLQAFGGVSCSWLAPTNVSSFPSGLSHSFARLSHYALSCQPQTRP